MIKQIIRDKIRKIALERKRRLVNGTDLWPAIEGLDLVDLTKEEEHLIKNRRSVLGTKPSWEYWRLYKTYCGFNENFIADNDYVPLILRCLNPNPYYHAYELKNTYPIVFRGLNQARTLLNGISGVWYDGNMNPVKQTEECLQAIFEKEESFIIKPTIGTSSGRGVQKISDKTGLIKLLQSYGKNFICQSVVQQSEQMARFNPDSLNTLRFSTLNINGKCTVVNRLFRHGQPGYCIDNGGGGGTMVGIDTDGQLASYGWNKQFVKIEQSHSGIKYGEVKFENFAQLVAQVEQIHQHYLPNMGFAGWDFALDNNNELLFIECNLAYPGIMFEQLCSASPLFGDRTDEVFDYVKQRMHRLRVYRDFLASSYNYE